MPMIFYIKLVGVIFPKYTARSNINKVIYEAIAHRASLNQTPFEHKVHFQQNNNIVLYDI